MEVFVLLLIWSAVTYRVTRFVILDSLVIGPRVAFHDWLLGMEPEGEPKRVQRWVWAHRPKGKRAQIVLQLIHELFSCPACLTIWVAAATLAVHRLFVGSFPMPVFMWLAAASGALIWWTIIDSKN